MSLMGRWLVRETWKPVAGPQITVYTAATAANSMPDGGKWDVDTAATYGNVEGEVIGFAKVKSNSYLGHQDSIEELIETVEEVGEIVYWEEGKGPDGDAEPSKAEDDPEPSDDDESAEEADDSQETVMQYQSAVSYEVGDEIEVSAEGGGDGTDCDCPPDDDALMGVDICVHCESEIEDGWCPDCDGQKEDDPTVEPDPSGESKTLRFDPLPPEENDEDDRLYESGHPVAEPTDYEYFDDPVYRHLKGASERSIQSDVLYIGTINNVREYGVFVSLTKPYTSSDVTGLVHKSNFPLARTTDDYQAGDRVFIELQEHAEKGPRFRIIEDEVDKYE